MRKYTYINGIEGVSANGTAIANIPINRRYHMLDFFITDGAGVADSSKVTEIRLLVNGVLMRRVTPSRAQKLAQLEGIATITGHVPILFSNPIRATVIGEEATAWDVFGQNKFTVEVDFVGATTPGLKIGATYDEVRNLIGNQPFLAPVKQQVQSYTFSTGPNDITNLPTAFPLQRVHLQNANITFVEVYQGTVKILEATKAENIAALALTGLDATAFDFPIVFDRENQVTSALDLARRDSAGKIVAFDELLIRVTLSAGGTVNAFYEQRVDGYR